MSGVVLLAGKGDATNAVYHALARDHDVRAILVEEPVPRGEFLKKRAKRLGVRRVVGQLAFVALVVPVLTRRSAARAAEIDRAYGLDRSPPPPELVTHVRSVNDDDAIARLVALAPDVVVLQGTRIVSKKLLSSVSCPVLNVHAGITPLYRGVHGGYWALANDDRAHCGVTVHVVDPGIDTGGIIHQATIEPTSADSYATYPHLQLGEGVRILSRAVGEALRGELRVQGAPAGPSRLWSHPTLGEYLRHRAFSGVR